MLTSVKEKLPEQSDTEYLVLISEKFFRVAYFYTDSYGHHWSSPEYPWEDQYTEYVSHWQELPDLLNIEGINPPTKFIADVIWSDHSPNDAGKRLAFDILNASKINWNDCTISLILVDSEFIISGYIHSFLQTIYNKNPELIEKVKNIKWNTTYDFQQQNISKWISEFIHIQKSCKNTNQSTRPNNS